MKQGQNQDYRFSRKKAVLMFGATATYLALTAFSAASADDGKPESSKIQRELWQPLGLR